MKTLIAASLLLALISPAHAAKAQSKDIPLIEEWQDNFWVCRRDPEGFPKACATDDKLDKKLAAKGYCTYARGMVGRFSRDREHCYEIDNLPAR